VRSSRDFGSDHEMFLILCNYRLKNSCILFLGFGDGFGDVHWNID